MVIDIKNTVIRVQIRRFIVLIVFAAIMIFILVMGSSRAQFLELSKYQWAIIISLVYLGIAIFESLLDYNYIYFSDEGDKVMLRYFSMGFFNKKKNSIEIPNKDFMGYSLEKKLYGFKEFIILIQNYKGKEANYPPVNITALSGKQREKLIASLERSKQYATTLQF